MMTHVPRDRLVRIIDRLYGIAPFLSFFNAKLDDGNNVFNAVFAIVLQPFTDNCRQTLDIELHHIFLNVCGHLIAV